MACTELVGKVIKRSKDGKDGNKEIITLLCPDSSVVDVMVYSYSEQLYYQCCKSFYINPSIEMDARAELEEFREWFDNVETELFLEFAVCLPEGEEITIGGETYSDGDRIYVSDDAACAEEDWLLFENADPYRNGEERHVYEYLAYLEKEVREQEEREASKDEEEDEDED